jgi:hypothetical protein
VITLNLQIQGACTLKGLPAAGRRIRTVLFESTVFEGTYDKWGMVVLCVHRVTAGRGRGLLATSSNRPERGSRRPSLHGKS